MMISYDHRADPAPYLAYLLETLAGFPSYIDYHLFYIPHTLSVGHI